MSQRKPLAEHISNALAALVEQQLVEFAACWPDDQPAQAAHRELWVRWADAAQVRPVDLEMRDRPRLDVRSLRIALAVELAPGWWWPLCKVRIADIVREDGRPIADRADVRALLIGLGWIVPAGLEDLEADLSGLVPDDARALTEPPAGEAPEQSDGNESL